MESEFYCEVVHFMIKELEKQFDEEEFYIVHDNAKFSKSVETQTFLIRNGLTHHFKPIPAYSPDMNLIENVWPLFKGRVRSKIASERQIKDEFQFVSLMSDEWKGLPGETIRNLYSSLPRRMANIIELDGRMTRY